MLIQAVTLLTISAGLVIGAPTSRNTQDAVQQDISDVAQNLFLAGRSSMPDFQSFAKLLNPNQAQEAVRSPSLNNLEGLSRKDVESLRQMLEQSLINANGAANAMQEQRKRRSAELQLTGGLPLSDEMLKLFTEIFH